MLSFEKLFILLKKKKISQYSLINDYGISPAQITRFKRNENVSSHSIAMMCEILDCNVDDICEYIPNEKSSDSYKSK